MTENPAVAGNGSAAPGQVDESLFAVVKGNPGDEELAALAAVVLSLAPEEEEASEAPAGTRHWVRRRQLRLGPVPGPGAWRRGLY